MRNQRAVFVTEQSFGEGDNIGGSPDGPQITVQDAEGVTANIDIAIRYSLDPDAVIDIYSAYYNEDNLRTRLIFNDIRSVVRSSRLSRRAGRMTASSSKTLRCKRSATARA